MTKTDKQLLYFMLAIVGCVALYRLYLALPDPSVFVDTSTTKGWHKYTSTQYGFSFLFPPHWGVLEEPRREITNPKTGKKYVLGGVVSMFPSPRLQSQSEGGFSIEVANGFGFGSFADDGVASSKPVQQPYSIGGMVGTLTTFTTQSGFCNNPISTVCDGGNGKNKTLGEFHFTQQPNGWSANAKIQIYPTYTGSIDIPLKVLSTVVLPKQP